MFVMGVFQGNVKKTSENLHVDQIRLHQFFTIEISQTVMSAVFQFRVLKINLLIHETPIKGPNGQFYHLMNHLRDVLIHVHEDPRPDFLLDFVHNDSYLTNGTTFRILHGCFTILQNCTIMRQIIDRELREPHMGF